MGSNALSLKAIFNFELFIVNNCQYHFLNFWEIINLTIFFFLIVNFIELTTEPDYYSMPFIFNIETF